MATYGLLIHPTIKSLYKGAFRSAPPLLKDNSRHFKSSEKTKS